MAELRPFETYTGVQKRSASAQKVDVAHAYKLDWLLFVSVHTNLQDLIPTLALVNFVAYNYAAKVGIKSCRFVLTDTNSSQSSL